MPLPLLANTISKIEIQEQVMPIRILPRFWPTRFRLVEKWWSGSLFARLKFRSK